MKKKTLDKIFTAWLIIGLILCWIFVDISLYYQFIIFFFGVGVPSLYFIHKWVGPAGLFWLRRPLIIKVGEKYLYGKKKKIKKK